MNRARVARTCLLALLAFAGAHDLGGQDAASRRAQVEQWYREYMDAVNSHSVEKAMSRVARDSVYRWKGEPLDFRYEDERNAREWEVPMRARFEYEIVRVNGECIVVRHSESNLLNEALQARRLVVFEHCFREGKIVASNMIEVRDMRRVFPRALSELEAWLAKKAATQSAGLLRNGRLVFDGESGRKLVPFLTEYRALTEAARAKNEPVMRSFIAALNQHDVDAQYRHYSPDVAYLDNGSRVVPDKERSRPNREFEAANHAQWSYRTLGAGPDSLDVIVTEEMEFYRLLGVGVRSHRACYRFRDGKIFEVEAWDWTQSGRPYAATRDRFAQWVLRERPDAAARVINEGRLQFNAATAPIINLLLREWRTAGMPGSPPLAARLPLAQSLSVRGATSIPGGEK